MEFQYKGIAVHYTTTGKGTALVLLHGFLENRQMWDPFIAYWSTKYKIICIDLLGHGQTGNLGYVHTMEEQADMVIALLESLRLRKAVFAGHSMGGYISLAIAELYPEFIKGILLINSSSRADSPEKQLMRDRAIAAVKKDAHLFIELSIAHLFAPDHRDKLIAEIEEVKKQARKTSLQGIIAALEGMKIRNDREVILHFAPYPIQFIAGNQDTAMPITSIKEQIEGTKVQLIEWAIGHMSHLENPDELKQVVMDFRKLL